MNIQDMRKGNRYLAGDSLGYDIVIATSDPYPTTEQGSEGVRVDFIYEKTGQPDFFFETPGCPFTTYVEPR